jgi:predicted DsbA family dithiol-disulfide isomerase
MRIDIVSDIVCPWCYVGKRQLEAALELFRQQHPAVSVQVNWHPFQLNPDMQRTGISRADYLKSKFGAADPAPIYARVKQAAAQVNLDLPVEGILRQPNTALAHSLVGASKSQEQQDDIIERMFRAYFVEHVDFTQTAALELIASAAGYSPEQIAQASSEASIAQTQDRDTQVRAQGITGVPFFIVNQAKAVSGAVGAQALHDLLIDSLE